MTSTTVAPPQHRNAVLVQRVRAALEDQSGVGLSSMRSDELGDYLADLQGLMAQVQAQLLSAVREADRREIAKTVGAANTGAWLSSSLRLRPEEAGRAVKLARDLDTELPSTREALQAGEVSADHAEVIARSMRRLPAWVGVEDRVEAEHVLLDKARTFDPKGLAGLGRKILYTIDEDRADRELAKQLQAEEARAEREREIVLYDDPYSVSTFLRGKLDPLTNEMFRVALEPLCRPRPTDANGPDLRTPAQRMGDGFHELLRRFLASGAAPSDGGEKPQIVLTIDPDKLRDGTGTGELLHTGASISALTAQEIACDAEVSVYTPGGAGSEPGDGTGGASLSDGVRLYTGKVRKLLELGRPRLRVSWLQSAALVVPGASHPPVEQGRIDHPRQRRPAVRLPPPAPSPRHLARPDGEGRTPRVHPTRMDRQAPQPTPQPPHQKLKNQRGRDTEWRRREPADGPLRKTPVHSNRAPGTHLTIRGRQSPLRAPPPRPGQLLRSGQLPHPVAAARHGLPATSPARSD